ncbi:hypothetical protein Dimus_025211 [Dionaea muscipula]
MEVTMATSSSSPPLPPPPPPSSSPHLAELVQTLEQAIDMAKHLPTTSDLSDQILVFSSLHSARLSLSSFLAHHNYFPTLTAGNHCDSATENSVSSAVGDGAEPMQVGDGGDEQNSKNSVDMVEEKMRDFFIQNKRPKRPLSPVSAAAAEWRRLEDHKCVSFPPGFDPIGTKLRALDLVHQFHA